VQIDGTGCSQNSALIKDSTGVTAHPCGTLQLTTAAYKLNELLRSTSTERSAKFSGRNVRASGRCHVTSRVLLVTWRLVQFGDTKWQFTAGTTKFIQMIFVTKLRFSAMLPSAVNKRTKVPIYCPHPY
jgi:hypothetical protein